MKQAEKSEGQERLIKEIEARQKNTVWPSPLINSRGIDAFLWNGSANPSKVQRIAAVVFGLFFISGAIMFASDCAESHSLWGLLSFGFLYVGARVLRNSLPRNSLKKS